MHSPPLNTLSSHPLTPTLSLSLTLTLTLALTLTLTLGNPNPNPNPNPKPDPNPSPNPNPNPNQGALLCFDSNLDYEAKQFEAVPHPPVRAMAYAGGMGMFGF